MTRRFLNGILLAALFSTAPVPGRASVESSVLESNVMYLRVSAMDKDAPDEIQSAESAVAATNKISGTVLDLRFAVGDTDSVDAAAQRIESQKLPLAILVNGETSGAAEKLAANLRAAKAGLIFGNSTELTPDISVSISAADEKKFLKNPFGTILPGDTNLISGTNNFLPAIDHVTEADLVRQKIKDGDEDVTAPPVAPKPFIRDPALARAVDFIKGVAVLHLSHS